MNKIVFLLISSLLLPVIIFAQDTIIQKNGVKLICKIQNQDNSTIYYIVEKQGQKIPVMVNSSIDKKEVQSIHFYNSNKRATSNTIKSFTIEKTNSIDLSIGLSAAIADFGSQDLNSATSGLAGNGFNINGVFLHRFNEKIGLSVKGYYNSNSFSTNLLATQMSNSTGYNFTTTSVNYTGDGIMIGPNFIAPGKHCSFVSRFLIGFSSLTEPQATFTVNSGGNSGWVSIPEVDENAFVYNIGGGLLFTITPDWYFIVNLDFIYSQYSLGSLIMTNSNGATQSLYRGNQPYQVINTSAGFGINF